MACVETTEAPSETAGRRGRPRLAAPQRDGASPADEILDAAAELFIARGFAATSTRLIADAVGVRQASLYHHFRTKDAILTALLDSTVRASLDVARALAADPRPALDRLLELAEFDATQLAASRWNLGALYLLPELRTDEFGEFRAARTELADHYARLAADVVGRSDDPRVLIPFRLVESVIGLRSDEALAPGGSWDAATIVHTVADAIRSVLLSNP